MNEQLPPLDFECSKLLATKTFQEEITFEEKSEEIRFFCWFVFLLQQDRKALTTKKGKKYWILFL
jgi:hypothetical protein